jgi:hypothetical protein
MKLEEDFNKLFCYYFRQNDLINDRTISLLNSFIKGFSSYNIVGRLVFIDGNNEIENYVLRLNCYNIPEFHDAMRIVISKTYTILYVGDEHFNCQTEEELYSALIKVLQLSEFKKTIHKIRSW